MARDRQSSTDFLEHWHFAEILETRKDAAMSSHPCGVATWRAAISHKFREMAATDDQLREWKQTGRVSSSAASEADVDQSLPELGPGETRRLSAASGLITRRRVTTATCSC